jgi:hypothetical protein
VEELDTFLSNVPIPSWRKMMKKFTNRKNQYKKKFYKKKKNFYSKEDISSSNMSEDENSKLLFMGMNTQSNDVYDE